MSSPPTPDFGRRAASYDRIRPVDDNWLEVFELVVSEADLRGRRVLDAGCGTGRLAVALAERAGARVWGIDPSPEMLAEARAKGVRVKQASVEELPFKDGWFERAVLWLVAHLVDRPRAFAELRRVLRPDGRLAIVTFDAVHISGYWLNRFFPSLEQIDRSRFPEEGELRAELDEAGFGAVRFARVHQRASLDRETALERVRGRHISTFDLIDEAEVRSGIARLEKELPDGVEYPIEWLIAVADC
jgi:ubiquinone/menaquinone biosynthesis C-methylase UbiE